MNDKEQSELDKTISEYDKKQILSNQKFEIQYAEIVNSVDHQGFDFFKMFLKKCTKYMQDYGSEKYLWDDTRIYYDPQFKIITTRDTTFGTDAHGQLIHEKTLDDILIYRDKEYNCYEFEDLKKMLKPEQLAKVLDDKLDMDRLSGHLSLSLLIENKGAISFDGRYTWITKFADYADWIITGTGKSDEEAIKNYNLIREEFLK